MFRLQSTHRFRLPITVGMHARQRTPPARICHWPRSQDCTSGGPLCVGGADTDKVEAISTPAFRLGSAPEAEALRGVCVEIASVSFQ